MQQKCFTRDGSYFSCHTVLHHLSDSFGRSKSIISVSIISRVMETVWGRVMLGTWRCAATTGAGPTRAWRPHTWCPGPWWPPPPTPAPWWRPRLSSSAPTPRQTAGVEVSAVLSIAIITQESGSQDKQYTLIFLLFSYEAFYFLSICPKVT